VDYLRENGHLMAVGLPAKSNLDASIFFTVFKSITIHGSYVGNRQDAIECINIAASGAVKVHYQLKSIDDLEKCVLSFCNGHLLMYLISPSIYAALGQGKIAGRIVLTLQ